MKLRNTLLIMLYVFWASSSSYAEQSPTLLLNEILRSEKEIRDMQAKIKWYEPETNNTLVVFEWGWESGKEFIDGHKWTGEDKEEPTSEIKYAFDGKVQRNLRQNKKENWSTGGIFGFTPDTFNVYLTPKALLGYSLKQHGQESFGEILSKTEELIVKKQREEINGRNCCILEASGITDGECVYDIRAWIDTERGFRPLKIEKYYSPQYKHARTDKKWAALVKRIDNIELQEIDGIWFPIKGDRHSFSSKWLPPEGMSENDFEKTYSHLTKEEQKEKMRFVSIPRVPTRQIEIDIDTIRINKDIEPEKFTIKFPLDCRVWDDTKQIGYVIGGGVGPKDIDPYEQFEKKSSDKSNNRSELLLKDETDNGKENPKNIVEVLEDVQGRENQQSERNQSTRKNSSLYYIIFALIIIFTIIGFLAFAQRKNKSATK